MLPPTTFGERKRNILAIICSSLVTALIGILLSVAGTAHPSSALAQSCLAWSLVPSPNIPTKINVLTSVSAYAANDIWAVGYSEDYGNEQGTARTLTMHWDGSTW